MISSEGDQWGRYNLPRYIYIYNIHIYIYTYNYYVYIYIVHDLSPGSSFLDHGCFVSFRPTSRNAQRPDRPPSVKISVRSWFSLRRGSFSPLTNKHGDSANEDLTNKPLGVSKGFKHKHEVFKSIKKRTVNMQNEPPNHTKMRISTKETRLSTNNSV